MNVLSFETSTKDFSLALLKDGRVTVFKQTRLKKVLSSSIIPAIEKILQKGKLSIKKIDGFAVGLGPGSFTSLRVGIATVKGLVFALKKPVVGISSLDAIAQNAASFKSENICVICDAKRNLVYSCLYSPKEGKLKKASDYRLCRIEEMLEGLSCETVFVGNAVKLYKNDIDRYFKEKAKSRNKAIFLDERMWAPRADQLGLLAYERFQKKTYMPLNRLLPIYLYPDDCQIKKT